jgi:hypothetical protein
MRDDKGYSIWAHLHNDPSFEAWIGEPGEMDTILPARVIVGREFRRTVMWHINDLP